MREGTTALVPTIIPDRQKTYLVPKEAYEINSVDISWQHFGHSHWSLAGCRATIDDIVESFMHKILELARSGPNVIV